MATDENAVEPTETSPLSERAEEIVAEDEKAARAGRYGWLSITIAAFFGLFYAYNVWAAIGNLVRYSAVGEQADAAGVPWRLFFVGILMPAVVFGVAILLGRRRGVLDKVVIFFTGLAVVSALSLALAAVITASLMPIR
jgi:hypothetical protein